MNFSNTKKDKKTKLLNILSSIDTGKISKKEISYFGNKKIYLVEKGQISGLT